MPIAAIRETGYGVARNRQLEETPPRAAITCGVAMTVTAVERRRATLVSADAAGYSRLMAVDELATIEAIKIFRQRRRLRPIMAADWWTHQATTCCSSTGAPPPRSRRH